MNRKEKILSTTIIIILMVVMACSITAVQARPLFTSSSSTSTNSSIHSAARINLLYLVRSERKDVFIQSSNYIIDSSVTTTTALVVNNHVVSTTSSSSDSTLQSLEFPLGRWHFSFRNPMTKGKWSVTKLTEGNGEGLVSYASVTVKNEVLGINKTLSVCLESTTFSKGLNFNTFAQKGLYLFFIPQLISSVSGIDGQSSNSYRIGSGVSDYNMHLLSIYETYNGGATLRLTELDNHYMNYHVWHLEFHLYATISGGYSDYIRATATSPLYNWWLKSDNMTTHVYGETVKVDGRAFFYGVFPLGIHEYWFAYPEVQTTATNHYSVRGVFKVYSGYFNDPIYTNSYNGTVLWKDRSGSIYRLPQSQDIKEWIL